MCALAGLFPHMMLAPNWHWGKYYFWVNQIWWFIIKSKGRSCHQKHTKACEFLWYISFCFQQFDRWYGIVIYIHADIKTCFKYSIIFCNIFWQTLRIIMGNTDFVLRSSLLLVDIPNYKTWKFNELHDMVFFLCRPPQWPPCRPAYPPPCGPAWCLCIFMCVCVCFCCIPQIPKTFNMLITC